MQLPDIATIFSQASADFAQVLPRIPVAIITTLAGLVVIRILSWIFIWVLSLIKMPKGLRGILASIINVLLTIFLIIVVLQSLGLNNLALIISAALAGMGIAFGNGSVSLVADVVAGISLANDKNFSLGDIVIVGNEDHKIQGEVVSMDMRRTQIKTVKGHVHSFPNTLIERQAFVLVTKKRDRKPTS